jgi:hypothetical protein
MTKFDPDKKNREEENISALRHPRGLHHLLVTDEEFEILDAIQLLKKKNASEGATFLEISTVLSTRGRMPPIDTKKLPMFRGVEDIEKPRLAPHSGIRDIARTLEEMLERSLLRGYTPAPPSHHRQLPNAPKIGSYQPRAHSHADGAERYSLTHLGMLLWRAHAKGR